MAPKKYSEKQREEAAGLEEAPPKVVAPKAKAKQGPKTWPLPFGQRMLHVVRSPSARAQDLDDQVGNDKSSPSAPPLAPHAAAAPAPAAPTVAEATPAAPAAAAGSGTTAPVVHDSAALRGLTQACAEQRDEQGDGEDRPRVEHGGEAFEGTQAEEEERKEG